jgi:sulfate/thiosulfate transport system substrate-binding protein
MRRIIVTAAVVAGIALALAACGASDKVSLVAYSTPSEAYKELIPAFQATTDGKDVQFTESYGASGEQSRAVEAGLKADVVEFSLAPDMDRLVKAGIVADTWAQNDHKGMVTDSVVVLVVRKGNPKGINGWDDLTKEDVEVIEPNPFTSGGAKWNIMAAYGAQLKAGKSPEEAQKYLADLFANVVVQDKSAREALQTFVGGKGDVLLSYENEAITAIQKGEEVEYIVPDATILIENPVAVTKDSPLAAEADAFVKYLWTEDAQKVFVSKGYRSVIPALNDPATFPTPPQLFTIDDLGGWVDVNARFFDPEASIVADIEENLGISTSK